MGKCVTMTTVTTVEDLAKNRVMSIRAKFENIEHLDITTPEIKRAPKYLFQRSATALNLSSVLRRNNNVANNNNHNNNKENGQTINGAGGNAGFATEGGKCKSETLALLRKSLRRDNSAKTTTQSSPSSPTATANASDIKTPTKLLVRQTSDPRRASIKRSPAFRVGETHQKISLAKSNSLNDFNSKRSTGDAEDVDSDDHLTDTLKKALQQPLPPGPPPKKPPRLLASPTTTNKPFPIQEEPLPPQQPINGINRLKISHNGSWSKKFANGIKVNVHQIPNAARPLLCCNNNSANVYDDVASTCYEDAQRRPLLLDTKPRVVVEMGRKTEPIYMEPFQHLKMNLKNGDTPSLRRFSGEDGEKRLLTVARSPGALSMDEERTAFDDDVGGSEGETTTTTTADDAKSMTGSIQTNCSCPERHTEDVERLQDLHYLVIYEFVYFVFLFVYLLRRRERTGCDSRELPEVGVFNMGRQLRGAVVVGMNEYRKKERETFTATNRGI